MNFCITGLPRSRTAWFAAYFSASGHKCAHEGLNGCATIEEYTEKMKGYEGNSDCCSYLASPDIKTVIIERNVDDVRVSLYKIFSGHELSVDNLLVEITDKLSKAEGLRVSFDDIDKRLEEIHRYCVGDTYNEETATMFKNLKIETNNYYVSEETGALVRSLLCH